MSRGLSPIVAACCAQSDAASASIWRKCAAPFAHSRSEPRTSANASQPSCSSTRWARAGEEPVENLYALARGRDVPRFAGAGLRTGHLHLHVSELAAAREFYRDVIGFEVQFEMPTAVFLSAGGYHHHVAVNTWRGVGVPPVPEHVVGMRRWTVVVTPEDLAAVASRAGVAPEGDALELPDPSGNVIRLEAE